MVEIHAEDMLWQPKRMVLMQGYDQAGVNRTNVINRMHWLLWDQCFSINGDPWKMAAHLHPIFGPDDPYTTKKVNTYQYYVWEDFDKYAEDNGTDYTVVNRDIYYWDTNLAWKIIPDLDETHLSQFPRIVEYGNDCATRGVVTNGEGYAGIATQPDLGYGIVDELISYQQEGDEDPDSEVPSAQQIADWTDSAGRAISGKVPSPVHVVIPANTTLMPGAPWTMADLVPGAWFKVRLDLLCRQFNEWQRLHQIVVTEEAPRGETVEFTATAPPSTMLMPS